MRILQERGILILVLEGGLLIRVLSGGMVVAGMESFDLFLGRDLVYTKTVNAKMI